MKNAQIESHFDQSVLADGSLEKMLGFNDEDFVRFNEVARGLHREQRWNDAADAYFFLTVVRPQQPVFWLGLGLAERGREEFGAAAKAFSMAAVLMPKNPRPLYLLALTLEAQGEIDEAQDVLQRLEDMEEAEEYRPEIEQLKRRWGRR